MSSEEQACLVRARSDSENSGRNLSGRGSNKMAYTEGSTVGAESGNGTNPNNLMLQEGVADSNDSGELIDYQDMSVLSQFHEDAIKQAGFGKHQFLIGGVFALVFAASGMEYASVLYVLPSADVEFCMTTRQKWWLSSITLLGIGCGSVLWGNLADRMGRRRTLVSCLCVNVVFSVIAAFMPTYGPFMMARFCSAFGAGGAPVSAVAALAEVVGGDGNRRARTIGPLLSAAAAGALLAAGLAVIALPLTGKDTVLENKEHFSAWHRYLLLCPILTIIALITLIWIHESPRYLLECGREVEALMIYQRIYKKNRSRTGGNAGGGVGGGSGGGGYQLSELELPSKRPHHRQPPVAPPPTSVLADMAISIHQFGNSFLQLFSAPFSRTTYMLIGAIAATLFCHIAFFVYAPNMIVRTKNAVFQANTVLKTGLSFENKLFNVSIENVIYENSTFVNCTFRDITFSHVVFRYCSFFDAEFTNIMSSFTFFEGSYFQGSKFIDTDLNTARHMDSACQLVNSTILGLSPACPLEADHNIYMEEGVRARAAASGSALIAMLITAILIPLLGRVPTTVGALILMSLSTPGMYFINSETSIIIFASVFTGLIAIAYVGLTLIIVESYPVHLRCTAHGFLYSIGHFAGLIAAGIYANLTLHSYILATLLTAVVAVMGTVFATRLVDSSTNLM
ncbi:synaptic vesicle glycoprotein 2B-like isoform X2 [Arctopsyche grandis]|uniref:synaptic vesicle glycoprotein 2B-like isoform X2 n=1 Tax=Arctopsyche grandis TaxID=121162 RepID=UPI00406D75F6